MLNKHTIIGRVGKDPDIHTFEDGGKIIKFSIATSEKWKNKDGEKQEKTFWHNIVVKNKGLINVCENYIKKGDLLHVEGQVEHRQYEKDGVIKYITETVLSPFKSSIVMLGGGSSSSNDTTNNVETNTINDDEIPF